MHVQLNLQIINYSNTMEYVKQIWLSNVLVILSFDAYN